MSQEGFALSEVGNEGCELTRRAIYFMLQRGSTVGSVLGGLVAATDLQTTYAGSGLKVEVAPGEVIVPGHNATQSGYYFRNTSAATFTCPAANGGLPRIERLVARVLDKSYEGSGNEFKLELIEGTPTPGATLANLSGVASAPNSSLTLAYILVPGGATSISNADIKNVAELCVPGLQAATYREGTAAERPAAGVKGRIYYATDTKVCSVDSGTAWRELVPVASTPSALVSREAGTEYLASATVPTQVRLVITGESGKGIATRLTVGGVSLAGPSAAAVAGFTPKVTDSFLCPAGSTWILEGVAILVEIESSYTYLS